MTPLCRIPVRAGVSALAAALLLFVLADRISPAQQPAPRDPQIAELEKQIDDLTRKLNELRKNAGRPTITVPSGTLDPAWIKTLSWRSIGPATMGGRITALAVFEADPSTFYVATASGGLLKTVNNGVTFEHQFDRQATVSIGDVCVAPSDRNIVWVGTGEANPRNSVSYGDGVYRSTDGGKSWQHVGLKNSFQIGKIVIHPKHPNIVYVGALGRLYGPNEERGLFKTTDGGKSWQKIFYIDDKTGVIDLQMHPTDPETLLVASWERWRDGFDSHPGSTPPEGHDGYDPMKKWSPANGIYKTSDGGKTFRKLLQGLPTCMVGRIGLDYQRKNPNVVFAIIDSEKFGMGPPQAKAADPYLGISGADAETGARLAQVAPNSPAAKAGLQAGDIVIGIDTRTVATYAQLIEQLKGRKVGDKLNLRIVRAKEGKDIAVTLEARPPGQFPNRPFAARLASQAENVQDKQGALGFQYGGVYKSTDGGESWARVNSLNPRPMYFSQVRVDPIDDQHVFVLGVQLHRSSDGGKTFKDDGAKTVHADHHAMWIDPKDGRHLVLGSDGGVYVSWDRGVNWDFHNHMALGQFYHVCVDSRRPYHVYGGLQDNGSWGGPSRTLRPTGPTNDDWIMVGGGDGFVCRADPTDPDVVYAEMQNGAMFRRNLRTGQVKALQPKADKGASYRFNWNAPFILSSHNPSIFYAAGNYVFRSLSKGDDLKMISPEITRTKRGSGTALAESPRNPDVLWAGTDDGFVWLTRDGGKTWNNVTPLANEQRQPPDALPGPRWVATIEASRFALGRAYLAFDAHRSDDDQPYLFVTEDFGQSWKSIRANLPTGSSRVLREDVVNPDLLFVGTEFACWASLDRGKSWLKLNTNLPTVAVHELAIHPTAGEMVAATHGRSLWVLDITTLRQMTPAIAKAPAHLFAPSPAIYWRLEPNRGASYGSGNRRFVGENPARGATLYYALTHKPDKLGLKVLDYTGKTVRELQAKATDPGLHKLVWDLRTITPPAATLPQAQPKGPRPGPTGQQQLGPAAAPGTYRVVLTVDGVDYSQSLRVENDPAVPGAVIAEDQEEFPKEQPQIK